MTTAVNIFLKAAIREGRIPFELKVEIPNEETLGAFEEAKQIANELEIMKRR